MGKISFHNKEENRDETLLDLLKKNSKIETLGYKELSCLKGGEEEDSDLDFGK